MIIVCDQARLYKSVVVDRKTKTHCTSCEYRLIPRRINVSKMWKVTKHEGAHNHVIYKDLDMHTHARCLTI